MTALYDLARARGVGFAEAVSAVKADPTLIERGGSRVAQDVETIERLVEDAGAEGGGDLGQLIEKLALAQIDDEAVRAEVAGVFTRVLPVTQPEDLEELLRVINVSLADVEQEVEAGAVNIMTMHQAKGLSATAVFVAGAEDEYIPGRATGDAVDDERRLLYVSLTRARNYLYVSHCQRRTGAQAHSGRRNAGDPQRTLTTFLSGGPIPSSDGPAYAGGLGT